mgnify:CR=1 FL=1
MKIALKLIAQKIDEAMCEWETYYNPKTGKMVELPDDENFFIDDDMVRLAEEIENNGDFLRLPNQYEVKEYRIMRDFALGLHDEKLKIELLDALTRKHPYRRFKDVVKYYEVAEAYYDYKFNRCYELAKAWCIEHSVDFFE